MRTSSFRIVSVVMTIGSMVAATQAFGWGRFDDHHRPVVIHRGGGCVGCGVAGVAVAGLVGGAILGAAIAGSAPPPPPTTIVVQGPPMGAQVAVLPPGCASMNINGGQYYQCGPVWYQPFFGGGGVYYSVVPTP